MTTNGGVKQAHAVIGASYGDEGKGLVTDFLCRYLDADMVVRFNGGAQAGHTVVDGAKRHVFHHIGAGAFAGASTLLGPEFICNPLAFKQERESLPGLLPPILVFGDCRVTTHYDMLLNQYAEKLRGKALHGSCGLGINETVVRHTNHPLYVSDIYNSNVLVRKLTDIKTKWVPRRAKQLRDQTLESDIGADVRLDADTLLASHTTNSYLLEDFYKACRYFHEWVTEIINSGEMHASILGKRIIFEGAQGLALDQNNRAGFPYLTRSNTGLQNVVQLCSAVGINDITATYVTRTYLTRHGAGPLDGGTGLATEVYPGIKDDTNVPHKWQGSMRYASHSLDSLGSMRNRINHDLASFGCSGIAVQPYLAITCVDHSGGDVSPHTMADFVSLPLALYSQGPTADDVTAAP